MAYSGGYFRFINGIVAGAGLTLLATNLLGGNTLGLAIGVGGSVAMAHMTAFLAYQRRRYRAAEAAAPREPVRR